MNFSNEENSSKIFKLHKDNELRIIENLFEAEYYLALEALLSFLNPDVNGHSTSIHSRKRVTSSCFYK